MKLRTNISLTLAIIDLVIVSFLIISIPFAIHELGGFTALAVGLLTFLWIVKTVSDFRS